MNNQELGTLGEFAAQDFLIGKGYEILEMNWRFSKAEIDIIAKHEETLIFIEVKTRSSNFFGEPESFVTEKKELLIIDAANVYMEKIGHEWAVRFDIIALTKVDNYSYKIKHFEDAFY